MITMLVSLYTSRVILKTLGIDDYGVYQTVGGIVGFLSFISGALSTGSSRFLTFELGTGNKKKLQRTFSTTFTIHIIIALVIVVLAESLGSWFISNKLVIPIERLSAAKFVFHISVLTAVFSITQIPYNASIIAHERMNIFAFVSIFDAFARLGIVYLLYIGNFDKLKLYALLLCVHQIGLILFYRFYCIRNFEETKFRFIFDYSIFKSIAGFSGWSLFANGAIALNNQGVLILLNMFFAPAVVAARAISLQVNGAVNQFVSNFRTAVNPQVVKLYASGKFNESESLLLSSTKYSYYLMWILCLPVFILAEPLLEIWLVEVPEYTIIFLRLIVIQSLFQTFDRSFYAALYAKGQLRENALTSPLISFLIFPVTYFFLKAGYSPVSLSWASIIAYAIIGVVIKPILLIRVANYKWQNIKSVFVSCFWVTLISAPIPLISNIYINSNTVLGFILVGIISLLSVVLCVYFIGLDRNTKHKIINQIKIRIVK